LAMIVHNDTHTPAGGKEPTGRADHGDLIGDAVSNDSNKNRRSDEPRSADLAGAVVQPRRMQ
jgi:hypothetical protein